MRWCLHALRAAKALLQRLLPELGYAVTAIHDPHVLHLTDNGLFTSSTTSPDWQTGRGLLSRGFNQLRLAGYFPLVMDKIRVFTGE
jgi:hypothetical protein